MVLFCNFCGNRSERPRALQLLIKMLIRCGMMWEGLVLLYRNVLFRTIYVKHGNSNDQLPTYFCFAEPLNNLFTFRKVKFRRKSARIFHFRLLRMIAKPPYYLSKYGINQRACAYVMLHVLFNLSELFTVTWQSTVHSLVQIQVRQFLWGILGLGNFAIVKNHPPAV